MAFSACIDNSARKGWLTGCQFRAKDGKLWFDSSLSRQDEMSALICITCQAPKRQKALFCPRRIGKPGSELRLSYRDSNHCTRSMPRSPGERDPPNYSFSTDDNEVDRTERILGHANAKGVAAKRIRVLATCNC